MLHLLSTVIVLSFVTPVFAQSAHLSLEATEIAVGGSTEMRIIVENVSTASSPEIGEIDGLKIRSRGVSQQMQIINGQVSRTTTYSYLISGLKPGEYRLGPFTVKAGRQNLTTSALTLKVVEQATTGPATPADEGSVQPVAGDPLDGQLFLRLALPKRQYYTGEKVRAQIKLYVGEIALQSLHYPQLNQAEVLVEGMEQPAKSREIINGQSFQVFTFSPELTMIKTGEFTLGPVQVDCSILVRNHPFPSFFEEFFAEERPLQVQSNTLDLEVLALPVTGRPADFSGAVGQFELEVSASPTEVLQGDPITLKMIITGQGNLSLASAPVITGLEQFKVYDPQKDFLLTTDPSQEKVVFEQIVLPLEASITALGPFTFCYFEPATAQYQRLTVPALPITVRENPDFQRTTSLLIGRETGEELGQDLVFIKNHPGHLRQRSEIFYRQSWFWLLQIIPLLFFLTIYTYRRYKQKQEADTPAARSARAYRQANKALQSASQRLAAAGPSPSLLDELNQLLREYLGVTYNYVAAAITANIADELRTKIDDQLLLAMIKEFFAHYDYYKFTGATFDRHAALKLINLTEDIIYGLNAEQHKINNTGRRGDSHGK